MTASLNSRPTALNARGNRYGPASANRDEDVFTDPFTFDVGRTPNKHLAFGFGVHYCLGAMLARMEMKALFKTILPHMRNISRAIRSKSGVDIAAGVDDETIAEIRRALLEHLVIFFRGQRLDDASHKAFSRRFGELFVDTALARHSTIQPGLIEAYANVYKVEVRPDTPEEAAETKAVMSRGSNSPDIVEKMLGMGAEAVGSTPDAIYDELVANTVTNGHMVAAGVIATTRAQEYGYTVLVAG